MMRDALRYGLIAAVVAVILALSGIFASFAEREVIEGRLNLDAVTLALMVGGAGLLTASRARKANESSHDNVRNVLIASLIGALCVGVGLALLVIVEANIDLTFVFPNLVNPIGETLTFGQAIAPGLLILMGVSAILGIAAAGLALLSARLRGAILVAALLTVVVGLLQQQIRNVIALPDVLTLAAAFGVGYLVVTALRPPSPTIRAIIGVVGGAIIGAILAFAAANGGLADDGWLVGVGSPPVVLAGGLISVIAVCAVAGGVGGLITGASRALHNGSWQLVVGIAVLGVANWQGGNTMSDIGAIFTAALTFAAAWLVPAAGSAADARYAVLSRPGQRRVARIIYFVGLLVLIAAPPFLGVYITDVLNLVGLYIILGIGLNTVVGYAGLLDLGYVAFFAVGAYTAGLLTTPSLLTCGGVPAREIAPDQVAAVCTGIMTFWEAWAAAIGISALFGMLLGIPVLRLRGDYFAIVTLGFGEIIRLVVRFDDFKDLFGSAQGIANIPRPVIDLTALNPAWRIDLTGASGIYYLVLGGILVAVLLSSQLAKSRLGRSWMAMRADEDVAQAMGINLTQIKLAAFALGAAFAGMAGAVQGTRLFGAYPDSYTLLVSINVLSLIIIGGLGSIPGIVVGAFVLVGLPEALRELADYRLLAFGALLVAAMLLKPQGLIPPSIREWTQVAFERGYPKKGAS
jgi:branched-chain amino acid transport system permease protein